MKKNLITVLKKLLTAFGGDSEQVKNNAVDIIDKIADNASGGSSGGSVFAVEFTSGQGYHLISNKTLKEIYDNAFQGILCVINGGPTHISSSFANFNFAKESDGRCNISLEMTSGGIGYTILYMYFSSEEEIDWNATDWTFPD